MIENEKKQFSENEVIFDDKSTLPENTNIMSDSITFEAFATYAQNVDFNEFKAWSMPILGNDRPSIVYLEIYNRLKSKPVHENDIYKLFKYKDKKDENNHKKWIEERNKKALQYQVTNHKLSVSNGEYFNYRAIGSTGFKKLIKNQLNKVTRSKHAREMLSLISRMDKIVDIVEFNGNSSLTAYYKGSIVIMHNATLHQGLNLIKFQSENGVINFGNVSPEITLIHELFHTGHIQVQEADKNNDYKETLFTPNCNWLCRLGGGPSTTHFEITAVKFTNLIRLDLKLRYIRSHYTIGGGRQIDTYIKAKKRWKK